MDNNQWNQETKEPNGTNDYGQNMYGMPDTAFMQQAQLAMQMEHPKRARRDYTVIGLALFTFGSVAVLVQLLFAVVLALLYYKGINLYKADWINYADIIVPMYVVAFPISIFVFRQVKTAQPHSEKIPLGKLLSYFLMCFPTAMILNLFSTWLASVLTGGTAKNAIETLASDTSWIQILTMVVLGPIVEELIFRKLIIDRARKYGEATAIFFSAVAFGLFHMNLFQIFYAFALGLIFGYVYVRSGRIYYTIIMHMLFNFWGSVASAAAVKYLNVDLYNKIASDFGNVISILSSASSKDRNGLILYFVYAVIEIILVIAGLICLIVNFARRSFQMQKAEEELPKGKWFKTIYLNFGVLLFVFLCVVIMVMNLLA